MTPEKHGAEKVLFFRKKSIISRIFMISKHGIKIIMENKFTSKAPCFQEFPNPRKMEKAMNI
jgi:hypothetical protein